MQGGYLPSGPNRYVLCCTPYLSSRSCSRDCSFTGSIPCRRKRFVKPFCSRFSIRFQKDSCQQINRKNIWRFPYCTAPKRYFFYQPLTNGSQNGVSKKKEPVRWTYYRSIYRLYLAFAIIQTLQTETRSKLFCIDRLIPFDFVWYLLSQSYGVSDFLLSKSYQGMLSIAMMILWLIT